MDKQCIAVITKGVLSFVASFFDNNGYMLSYFQRSVNIYCYTSCTLTTLKYISFISIVFRSLISIVLSLKKYILNVLPKCEGCTHF